MVSDPATEVSSWILLVVGLLSFLPILILIRYYRRTRVLDYLLLAGMFSSITITQFGGIFYSLYPDNNLLFEQIVHSSHVLIYVFMFLHSLRLKWDRPPKILWYIGIIWAVLLQIAIFLYPIVDLPDPIGTIFKEMLSNNPGTLPFGYITSLLVFRLSVLLLFVYVYLTTEHVIEYDRLNTVRNIWILAIVINSFYPILSIGHFFSLWTTDFTAVRISNLISMLIVAYGCLVYPEAVLLSEVQVLRALELYKFVESLESKEQITEFGMSSLANYLKELPPELLP